MLDGLASLIGKAEALDIRRLRDRRATRSHAGPPLLAVDEHATIAQQLAHHRGAALHIAERDELQRPAQVWLKALTQPLQAKGIITPKRYNNVEVGVGVLFTASEGAEDHGQRDVWLGPQYPPQRTESSQ